ncbi:MAG: lysoplasmalogenase [Treponema sp.]|nr:lysoplasmalogenase [Treponema sp.]
MTIFLVLLGLVSLSHVAFIILEKETLRRISKCLIVPLLLAAYIAGGGRSLFPILALLLGWSGDILLIKIQNTVNFKLGLASFLLGHICYIIAFIGLLGIYAVGINAVGIANINIPSILIFTPPTIALGAVVFRLIKPTREMRIPVIIYMIVLVTMNFLGFQVFLANPGLAGLLILSGCFNFIVSDTILSYYTFRKLKLSGAVLIMVFYIVAQTEIIMGLLLL